MAMRPLIAVLLSTAAFAAGAQQLYRWTDDKGRVHVTDTPPPASARNVKRPKPTPEGIASQPPYALEHAMKSYPVTLYTSPSCKEACQDARTLLNKRAVPFKEVQVFADEPSHEELKKVSGASEVPTLVVGRSVHRGYQAAAYDALLDAARYPRAGLLPPRSQAAPPLPQSRDGQDTEEEELAPRGPYAPRPGRN
jgi:glutaredoxin